MTVTDDLRDKKNSVTRFDLADEAGGVIRLNVWNWGGAIIPQVLPRDVPPGPGLARDQVLSSTPQAETMWASAIAIAATQFAARSWEIEGDAPRLKERTQAMLLNADGGAGWVPYTLKCVQDYLCCGVGMISEIERYGRGPGARIKAIHHLDALRCRSTGDRNNPIAYMADDGEHLLPWYNVLRVVDMPSPRREHLGCGWPAAARAYRAIIKLAGIENYLYEKVTGQRPLAVHVVSGIRVEQINDAIASARQGQVAAGNYQYMGVVLASTLKGDTTVSGYTIPLAELPDRFQRKEEFDIALLSYADAIGLDPQDLQPMTGQQLGAGAQSQVLNQKARGRGMRAFEQAFVHAMNALALAASVRQTFVERDLADQKAEAEIRKLNTDIAAQVAQSGLADAAAATQILVDADVLSPAALPSGDTTPNPISDTDKPTAEDGLLPDELEVVTKAAPRAPDLVMDAGHTGVMVALPVPADVARRLAALPGATEPAEQLHVTLAYLGDSSETPLENNKARVLAAVDDWAQRHGRPLRGAVNGVGRFLNVESDGTNAVYVSPDVPGLAELRQALVQAIEAAGFDYAQDHGFTPHITVSYVPADAPGPNLRPDEIPVAFDRAVLVWGDEWYILPLGLVTKEASDDGDLDDLLSAELDAARRLATAARRRE